MTELEVSQNAKACLDWLAQGIDPFTKQPVPENDVVRKASLVKYLKYISNIMDKNIEELENKETPEQAKIRFFVSEERKANFQAEEELKTISNIFNTINEGISQEQDGFIPRNAISDWLESKQLLEKRSIANGSYRRVATAIAQEFGIENQYNAKGNFKNVVFDTQAQQWIYDCIDEISEYCVQHAESYPKLKKVDAPPMDKIPEQPLYQLTTEEKISLTPFADSTSISEITKYLNSVIATDKVKPLKNGMLSSWLASEKLLQRNDKKKEYLPTAEGRKIGISSVSYVRNGYEYQLAVFSHQAQQYIFDNIDSLIEFNILEN